VPADNNHFEQRQSSGASSPAEMERLAESEARLRFLDRLGKATKF
jgi:hypothetical protein